MALGSGVFVTAVLPSLLEKAFWMPDLSTLRGQTNKRRYNARENSVLLQRRPCSQVFARYIVGLSFQTLKSPLYAWVMSDILEDMFIGPADQDSAYGTTVKCCAHMHMRKHTHKHTHCEELRATTAGFNQTRNSRWWTQRSPNMDLISCVSGWRHETHSLRVCRFKIRLI